MPQQNMSTGERVAVLEQRMKTMERLFEKREDRNWKVWVTLLSILVTNLIGLLIFYFKG